MIETIVAMALVTWVIALAMTPAWLGPVSFRSRLLERSRLLWRSRLHFRSRIGPARSRLSVLA
ncbi:hypothetical protein [Dongia sp.]|uniref:hypothetical protein n=1 Tax=Dongia sp. TaxID=1977262 RepID=UPI0035AF42BE